MTANTKNVNSSKFVPYTKLKNPLKYHEKEKDILVVGKRKPFLNLQQDKARVEKYKKDFINLVNKYRNQRDEK